MYVDEKRGCSLGSEQMRSDLCPSPAAAAVVAAPPAGGGPVVTDEVEMLKWRQAGQAPTAYEDDSSCLGMQNGKLCRRKKVCMLSELGLPCRQAAVLPPCGSSASAASPEGAFLHRVIGKLPTAIADWAWKAQLTVQ